MKRPVLKMRLTPPFVIVIVCVLLAAVVLGAAALLRGAGTNTVTAYFRNTAGLYVGDRVMILGVEVGSISGITPEGDRVRVDMDYDNDHPVPADAGAVIIAPTLVTGRYVQLAPSYSGGPTLADGAVIDLDKTASPVEFDEVKKQVVELARDVGETPENPDGALSEFVETTASTLDGNGQALHDSLADLSAAVQTLEKGSPDLFTTVENLQVLSTTLAENDGQIAGFSNELADLSGFLNNNRTELDAALSSMSVTFTEVTSFLEDNHELLRTDVEKLNTITGLLVDRQDTLASILHTAPTALSNFYNIYDEQSNSLTGALAVPDVPDPHSLICALLTTANAPGDQCKTVTDTFGEGLAEGVRGEVEEGGR